MKTSEKIEFYSKFNEETELTDAVSLLLRACRVLNGISADHELQLVLLTVEKLIRDEMEYARTRQIEWEQYDEINPELYSYFLGGATKLTEEEYNS